MKSFLISLCALTLLMLPGIVSAQPVVSNVSYVQESDGAGNTRVRVTYDLASPNGPCDVELQYSTTGAAPFTAASSTIGAVGAGVVPGTGLMIDWAVAADLPGQTVTGNFVVRVLANDGVELLEFVSVPAGTFTMGNSEVGDDLTFVGPEELPRHEVTLSAYDIGKFEVTNAQFATVMNWALAQGYLAGDTAGAAYTGQARVYLMTLDSFSSRQLIFDTSLEDSRSMIEWTGSEFAPRTRDSYDMSNYPVNFVSWFGAVSFCNFLAEMEGKPLAYNTSTWTLVDADPVAAGLQYVASYRLPTESEWERAASWDGIKHWIYGTTTDTISTNRAIYGNVNPMGLSASPLASPVGWYNGINISPSTSTQTIDSPSPVGAYDMSGNMTERVHDSKVSMVGYTADAKVNPTGAAGLGNKVSRGGSWNSGGANCRTAKRTWSSASNLNSTLGFRVAAVRQHVPLSITGTVAQSASTSNATETFTFTFGEAVTGFDITDIAVTNATLANFTTVSADVYTVEVTASALGTVLIEVSTGAGTGAGSLPSGAALLGYIYE